MTSILRNSALSRFVCTGDQCEDTCCKQWSMQVDESTLTRYRNEAPSLLEAVEPDNGGMIMRKSPETGYCVKLDGGLCGIHKDFGKNFLGDACFFYPRVTRNLGERTLMTATLSCPEIARLTLGESAWEFESAQVERLPSQIKDYLPPALTCDAAIDVHNAFLAACDDEQASAEQIFARIAGVARALERIDQGQWHAATGFYLRTADGRLPQPQPHITDPFNLLHALCGLIVAAHKPRTPRITAIIEQMEQALCVSLDWQNVTIRVDEKSMEAYQHLSQKWGSEIASAYTPILRRWLKMQIALSLFPFAGLGDTLTQRITIIGVRFATLKLAIMCNPANNGGNTALECAVHVAQSLSRVLDHLGSSRFSLDIYAEPQWLTEARMLGLIGFTTT